MPLTIFNLVRLFVTTAIVFTCSSDANASSNAGIEIEVGSFKLSVYYSDALEYYNDADKAIRDPQNALFELAAVIQANSKAFAVIEHSIYVELYTRKAISGNYLKIIEDPSSRNIILQDGPVGQQITKEILKAVCSRYSKGCKQPIPNSLDLYPCHRGPCPGQIRFGAFPSDSVNKKYGLLQPQRKAVKRISVSREQMRQYFNELE